MAQHPMFPLWTDAYLADTQHLTTLEHGAYLLLLMTMWRSKEGTLPDDDRQLARFAGLRPEQWKRVKPTLMGFFRAAGDGRISQARLADERERCARLSQSQSHRARARWADKSLPPNDPPNAGASERHESGIPSGNASPTQTLSKQAEATVAPTSEAPPGSTDGAAAAPASMTLDASPSAALADKVADALGARDQRWAITGGIHVQRWLDAGATPDAILAAARAVRARRDARGEGPPSDPRYLDGAVADAMAKPAAAADESDRRRAAIIATLPSKPATPAPYSPPPKRTYRHARGGGAR